LVTLNKGKYAKKPTPELKARILEWYGLITDPAEKLTEELKRLGREDIMVIAGGVIPAQDYDFLYKAGVAAIFGPGTSVAKAACEMMKILLDKE